MAGAPGWSRDEVAAYLALAQVPGIGAARLHTLVAAFETAAAAVHAPHGAIAALPGFSRAAATAVRASSLRAGREILAQLDRLGAGLLLPGDPAFHRSCGKSPMRRRCSTAGVTGRCSVVRRSASSGAATTRRTARRRRANSPPDSRARGWWS